MMESLGTGLSDDDFKRLLECLHAGLSSLLKDRIVESGFASSELQVVVDQAVRQASKVIRREVILWQPY